MAKSGDAVSLLLMFVYMLIKMAPAPLGPATLSSLLPIEGADGGGEYVGVVHVDEPMRVWPQVPIRNGGG